MKRNIYRLLAFLFVMVSLLVSCAPTSTEAPTQVKGETVTLPSRSEWDDLVAAAQEEGTAFIYTMDWAPAIRALREAFKHKFNIDLEPVHGRPAEVIQKLVAERNAGVYLGDTLVGGSSSLLTAKQAGITEPLEPVLLLPEVTDSKVWLGGGLYFVDGDKHMLTFASRPTSLLAYNTELVRPPLQSLRELLEPRWKGKIAMNDPSTAGSGNLFITAMGEKYGVDYLKSLAKQEPVISRDQRLQTEWIARGKYSLLTGPSAGVMEPFIEAGAPIRFGYPADHNFVSSGTGLIAVINRRPHPNATKVFLNWFLTKEGQTVFSKSMQLPSRRLDVTTEFVSPDRLLDPNKKYINMETEEMAKKRLYWQEVAQEIFAAYMK